MVRNYTQEIMNTTISMLRNNINENGINDYNVLIVDNGSPLTSKDIVSFGEYDIYYTNNKQRFKNKNIDLQLHDMLNCIDKYDIKDDDFVIKIDYNCIAHPSSSFIKRIQELCCDYNKFDCVICYGIINNTVESKIGKCINYVYGMRCKYLKNLNDGNLPTYSGCILYKDWASVSFDIPDDKTICMKTLGFYIHAEDGATKYISIWYNYETSLYTIVSVDDIVSLEILWIAFSAYEWELLYTSAKSSGSNEP